MNEATEDQVLEALRQVWGEAYEFGVGVDGFWARRRDGRGETLIDTDPDDLSHRIRDDFGTMPR